MIITVCSAKSMNSQIILGDVIQINNNIVQIKVLDIKNVHIGNSVNLYYKTPSGNEMKVGEWKVSKIDNKIIYAKVVDGYMPPQVGFVARIVIPLKVRKIKVVGSAHDNRNQIVENNDTQKVKKNIFVDSQFYVDNARHLMEDIYKNKNIYAKEKINNLWKQVIDDIDKGISLDNAEAYFLFALIYEDGYGNVKRDLKSMIDNFIKSAEKGYVKAQYILGDAYEDGDEVVKDNQKAIYWYEKAAQQGHKKAKRALDKLLKKQEKEIPLQMRGKGSKNFGIPDINDIFDLEK